MKETLESHVAALGPSLYETMSTATAKVVKSVSDIPHHKYPHVRPALTRTHWRQELEANPLPLGWTVAGNTRLNGQTFLYHPHLNARMRILKERRNTTPGGIPTAGYSPTRQQYWSAPLPGLDDSHPAFNPTNLLLCWDYASNENLEDFQLRVVHTLEPGRFGEAVKCDFMVDIEPGGSIYNYRSFRGSDDPEDFFTSINLDEDENEA